MADRRPGAGRYAHVEREQRWRLARVPPGAAQPTEILDRYVIGTRLRLRRAVDADGIVCKLGQKVRPESTQPGTVMLTNIYLSQEEYDV